MSFKPLTIEQISGTKRPAQEARQTLFRAMLVSDVKEARRKYKLPKTLSSDDVAQALLRDYNEKIKHLNQISSLNKAKEDEKKQKRRATRIASNPFKIINENKQLKIKSFELFNIENENNHEVSFKNFNSFIKNKINYGSSNVTLKLSGDVMKNWSKEDHSKESYVVSYHLTENTDSLTHDMYEMYTRGLDGEVAIDSCKIMNVNELTMTFSQQIESQNNIEDVRMYDAHPLGVEFLKHFESIDNISYEDHSGQCVVKVLSEYLGYKESFVQNIFEEAYKKLYDIDSYDRDYNYNFCGVTSKMVLYFCEKQKISCIGMDSR